MNPHQYFKVEVKMIALPKVHGDQVESQIQRCVCGDWLVQPEDVAEAKYLSLIATKVTVSLKRRIRNNSELTT